MGSTVLYTSSIKTLVTNPKIMYSLLVETSPEEDREAEGGGKYSELFSNNYIQFYQCRGCSSGGVSLVGGDDNFLHLFFNI